MSISMKNKTPKSDTHDALLFVCPAYDYMGKDLMNVSHVEMGRFASSRFACDELHITLQTPVDGRECFVIGSFSPPDENIFSLLLLCHTLMKENAAKITVLIPYLAYSRHDKNEPQKSYATALLGQLLFRAGADQLITVDVHSQKAKQLFPMPLISLSAAELFAKEIISLSMQNASIIAPDEGAIERCKAVASAAHMGDDITFMIKSRTENGIVHSKLIGPVKESALIIDDILDTGKTLVSCCKTLSDLGVREINIMVTHGLFSGSEWEKLWNLGVKHIYCTNTIELPVRMSHPGIITLSIIPLIRDAMANCHIGYEHAVK